MIFPSDVYLPLFSLFFICNISSYYLIRDIIWSIVWCDKDGNSNNLMKLKRNRSFSQKVSMNYLMCHVNDHKNAFVFWIRVKSLFKYSELILGVLYLVCLLLKINLVLEIIMIFILVQSVLISWIIGMQSDINRNTKYDRIRLEKKLKKKRFR